MNLIVLGNTGSTKGHGWVLYCHVPSPFPRSNSYIAILPCPNIHLAIKRDTTPNVDEEYMNQIYKCDMFPAVTLDITTKMIDCSGISSKKCLKA